MAAAPVPPPRSHLVALVTAFTLSRGAAWLAGVRFDATTLDGGWAFLDPLLLRTDLLRSVFYQHSNPPLFNLFLGAVLRAAPSDYATLFHLVYLALGLGTLVLTYLTALELGVAPNAALVVSTLFSVSPASLLYENWLFYAYVVAALLSAAAYCLARYCRGGGTRWLHGFFFLLAAVVLTRSLFHVGWMVLIAALVAGRRDWRTVAGCAALPVVIALAPYAKNQAVFGLASSSSWVGMSLARMTLAGLPDATRAELHARGRLSDVGLVPPFSPPGAYPDVPARGVPALDAAAKSTGAINYNHAVYAETAPAYLRDALYVAGAYPGLYLRRALQSSYGYTFPSSDYFAVAENRDRIGRYADAYNAAVHGRLGTLVDLSEAVPGWYYLGRIGWLTLAWYGLAIVFLAPRWRQPAMGFMLVTILYVAVVGNALEVAETHRFRFDTDRFVALALAGALTRTFNGRLVPA